MTNVKAELLASIKNDLYAIIRSEQKNVLAGEFDAVKSEIQAVRNKDMNLGPRLDDN